MKSSAPLVVLLAAASLAGAVPATAHAGLSIPQAKRAALKAQKAFARAAIEESADRTDFSFSSARSKVGRCDRITGRIVECLAQSRLKDDLISGPNDIEPEYMLCKTRRRVSLTNGGIQTVAPYGSDCDWEA